VADAYVTGLRMLARRELSEAQVRQRLTRKQFDADAIDAAVERLRTDRALDDRRTALACARTEAHVKRRGRLRALRQVESLGIDRDIARTAVAEVFADVDEDAVIAAAIDRRLRAGGSEGSRPTPADLRRVQQYLLRQGFDAGKVSAAIRKRSRPTDYNRSE
jgi:regulatory protein